MKRFLSLLVWDWRLQLRYHILTVAAVVTTLYVLVFVNLPAGDLSALLITLLFSDPGLLAFMFIGALVLFEKSAGTHIACAVTPMRPWHYLVSKGVSLSAIALLCSQLMALALHGWGYNWGFLSLAVVLTSLLFAWIGFIGVAAVKSFNQYLILIPILVIPLFVPLISLWGMPESGWLYLFPTQASLILFRASFAPVAGVKILYAILYLLLWLSGFYWLAEQAFIRMTYSTSEK